MRSAKHACAMAALLLASGCATTATSAAAKPAITRTINSPTATISSVVDVPPGSRLVFLSGATASPIDPAKPDELGDTATQTRNILTRIKTGLEGMGLTMGDVVKMTVFLVGVPANNGQMDSAGMNAEFRTFFGTPEQPNRPARSTVQVARLGRPAVLVEIEAIAAKAP